MKNNTVQTVKVYDRNHGDFLGAVLMTRWDEYEAQAGDTDGFVVASEWLSAGSLAEINCQDSAVVYFERVNLKSVE